MNKVSIIIPAYNQARFLSRSIESALQQTHADVEVIVIDDGSTDETPAILSRYNSQPRFKSIRQPNAGLPATRNRGIAEAIGDYLCFLDSDDFYAVEKCARQAELLDKSPELGFVYCDFTQVDQQGLPLTEQTSIAQLQRTLSGNIFPALMEGGYFPPHTAMIRRSVLDEVGAFDPELGGHADYDLWLRAAAKYAAFYQDEKLAFYRRHSDSMSQNSEHMLRTRVATLRKIARLHPELAGDALNQLQLAAENLFNANQNLRRELEATPCTGFRENVSASNPATTFPFLKHLDSGRLTGKKEQSAIWEVTLDGRTSKALLLQPPAELAFELPGGSSGLFTADVALHPDVWERADAGGCEFQVQIDRRLAYALVIDPAKTAVDRRWHPIQIEVPAAPNGNHQIVLRTRQIGRPDYRWALWRNPLFTFAADQNQPDL